MVPDRLLGDASRCSNLWDGSQNIEKRNIKSIPETVEQILEGIPRETKEEHEAPKIYTRAVVGDDDGDIPSFSK